MSIGLYDVDMVQYHQTPFSLELMKYSSYYKNKNEIVVLTPTFNPNKYTTFIVRKDYQDGKFPHKMETYDNIIYGGHGFSGDRYIPLDESIEKQKPDPYIYERNRLLFGESNRMVAAFDVMMRAQHLRLSLDGKTVWPQFEKQLDLGSQTRTLFFHDYNLNEIEGGREVINYLVKKIENGASTGFIAMKFPVIINQYEDLLYWCGFKSSGSFYNLEYRGPLSDEELYDFIKNQDLKMNPEKIEYNITANFKNENDFLIRGLSQIYNQVLFLRMNRARILLKYDNGFFIDKRWERLIQLFNCFLSVTLALRKEHFNRVIKFDSLYSFCRSLDDDVRTDSRHTFNKQEARELFTLVRETNYDVFKAFYESHTVKLIGGNFENDTGTN